ncbi:hypothetical protein HDZ31DRAFT_67178 [Schizophyllum fasciatum]
MERWPPLPAPFATRAARAPALFLSLLVQSLLCARPARAFQWALGDVSGASNLRSCEVLDVALSPSSGAESGDVGTGPYYMLAFPVNGTPSMQHLGDSADALHWTVDQAPQSSLFLSVVDSRNASGGVLQTAYNVVNGSSTTCLDGSPNADDETFVVSSNVTTASIETCQPWGLRIKGGTPPYSIYLMSLGSSVVTNATMGLDNDAYTYINRAGSGSQIIAGVSDSLGRWATGSPAAHTTGDTDVTCNGMQSSFGVTAELDGDAQDKSSSSEGSVPIATVLGVVLGLGTPLLVLLIFGVVWWRRRRRNAHENEAVTPTAYFGPDLHGPLAGPGSRAHAVSTEGSSAGKAALSEKGRSVYGYPPGRHDTRNDGSTDGTTVPSVPTNFPPGLAPSQNGRRRAKGSPVDARPGSAGTLNASSPISPSSEPSPISTIPRSTIPDSPADENGRAVGDDRYPVNEVIIQHRDAGRGQTIIRELPPPYADFDDDEGGGGHRQA